MKGIISPSKSFVAQVIHDPAFIFKLFNCFHSLCTSYSFVSPYLYNPISILTTNGSFSFRHILSTEIMKAIYVPNVGCAPGSDGLEQACPNYFIKGRVPAGFLVQPLRAQNSTNQLSED